jgi:hypothetical protein
LYHITWNETVSVPQHGAAIVSVVGLDHAQEVSFALLSAAIDARFVPEIIEAEMDREQERSNNVPLLVLVNGKSGGGQGREVLHRLASMMNPSQIFDITEMGPLMGILMFRKVHEFRVVVCGGDGTVGWVLNTIEDCRHLLNCPSPAVAIIPIGTGNDLSRQLGWGAGCVNRNVTFRFVFFGRPSISP